jgi:hypothetical protein
VLHKICCEIVLVSLVNDALTVSEAAVAFENAGQPIELFPHTLRTAKQKNLVSLAVSAGETAAATANIATMVSSARVAQESRRHLFQLRVREPGGTTTSS